MAVNADFVGRSYPPSGPYAVDAASLAAFAAAVGSTDPVHSDAEAARAAGYARRHRAADVRRDASRSSATPVRPGPRGRHRLQPGRPRRAALRPPPPDHGRRLGARHPHRRRGARGRWPLDGHHPHRARHRRTARRCAPRRRPSSSGEGSDRGRAHPGPGRGRRHHRTASPSPSAATPSWPMPPRRATRTPSTRTRTSPSSVGLPDVIAHGMWTHGRRRLGRRGVGR